MLHKNVIEQKSGFRTLGVAEIKAVGGGLGAGFDDGGEGPGIIVIGQRNPYSVSPDWLANTNSEIGDFFDQLSDNNYDPFQDSTGDGGGQEGSSNDETFDLMEKEVTFIDVNDDGALERAEDTIEQALEEAQPGDWAVEYNENDGQFYAEIDTFDNDGNPVTNVEVLTFSEANQLLNDAERQKSNNQT